jgi:hypothetical protein
MRIITFRRGYALAALLLFVVELAIALWLDDRLIRPYIGDSLAVVLVYCVLRSVMTFSVRSAVLAALTIAVTIETAQLYQVIGSIGLADSMLARILLGTSFDPRDLLAYLLGAVLTIILETVRCRLTARLSG